MTQEDLIEKIDLIPDVDLKEVGEKGEKHEVTYCGVFTTRHMEMFMGSQQKTFDCGLKILRHNNEVKLTLY
ncbi:hypothetical protein E3N88_38902 [Mikania micrantha]|uniref:Uncharacterized protein n=1 Tax=Mikania micrantha TaxID=192012 RepID=A0A5N6LW46_9ASTR|nr:hypothetical protein E3N88_38902 [Mikania micrantha]